MVSMLRPKRKNERKKEYAKHHGEIEQGIYKNLKNENHYDVLVSMRIGKKQLQRKKSNFKFIGEARRFRDKSLEELETIKAKNNNGDMFWSQALEMYFSKLEGLIAKNEMSYSTYKNRKYILNAYTSDWATKRLSEFYQNFIDLNIEEKIKNRRTQKNDKKTETKNDVIKYIKQVFNYQITMGNKALRLNPAAGINKVKKNVEEQETISLEDMKKIIDYTHSIESEWASVIYLAFQLGCRSGELYALKWSDIDWNTNFISVGKSFCWKSEKEKSPKNNEYRKIPLNSTTSKYLKELKLKSDDSIFILPRIPAWKQGRAAKILNQFQYELGILYTNFHSIRATYITQLLLKDVPPVKVMELAGHKDFKTTMIYVRSVAKELKGATDCLSHEPEINPEKFKKVS